MFTHDDYWSDFIDVFFAVGVFVVVFVENFVAGLKLALVYWHYVFVGEEDVEAFAVGVEGV